MPAADSTSLIVLAPVTLYRGNYLDNVRFAAPASLSKHPERSPAQFAGRSRRMRPLLESDRFAGSFDYVSAWEKLRLKLRSGCLLRYHDTIMLI